MLYVTERCVFRLTPDGLALAEVAPGVDAERDILRQLPFAPVGDAPEPMDPAIFQPEPMGLRDRLLDIHMEDRLSYEPETNMLFMNLSGLRVRTQDDIDRIREVVDNFLRPIGKRVKAIINYDSFDADPEILGAYMDLVHYVEKTYYLEVSRYTTSGFMRLKLGKGLGDRKVSSQVYETRAEARAGLKS